MLGRRLDGRFAAGAATGAALAAPVAALAMLLYLTLPCVAQEAEPAAPTPTRSLTRIATPLALSLIVYPNYGSAPLTIGAYAEVVDPLGSEIVSYYWSFGNGKVSTLPAPLMVLNTYTRPGAYLVTLRVVTADGRSATAFVGVTVRSTPR